MEAFILVFSCAFEFGVEYTYSVCISCCLSVCSYPPSSVWTSNLAAKCSFFLSVLSLAVLYYYLKTTKLNRYVKDLVQSLETTKHILFPI